MMFQPPWYAVTYEHVCIADGFHKNISRPPLLLASSSQAVQTRALGLPLLRLLECGKVVPGIRFLA